MYSQTNKRKHKRMDGRTDKGDGQKDMYADYST